MYEQNHLAGSGAAPFAHKISFCTILGPRLPEPPAGAVGIVRVGIGAGYWEYQLRVQRLRSGYAVAWPTWLNLLRLASPAVVAALHAIDAIFHIGEKR